MNFLVTVKVGEVEFGVFIDQFLNGKKNSGVAKEGINRSLHCGWLRPDRKKQPIDLAIDGTTRVPVVVLDVHLHDVLMNSADFLKVLVGLIPVGPLNWKLLAVLAILLKSLSLFHELLELGLQKHLLVFNLFGYDGAVRTSDWGILLDFHLEFVRVP